MGAAIATLFPAAVIMLIGAVLLVAGNGSQSLTGIAHWVMGFAVVLLLLGAIRIRQGAEASRRFRGDRSAQKGPS